MQVVSTSSWSCSIFFSYILTNPGVFITQLSVIPIDEHELTTDHMTKKYKNSMERVEDKLEILSNLCLVAQIQKEYITVLLKKLTMLMTTY